MNAGPRAPSPGPRELPPPPHDPSERVLITRVDGWEVRDFAREDLRRAYLAASGFAHLQLWHPRARVSVLTPSRLTHDRFEAFPIAGWKRATRDYAELAAFIEGAHGVRLLSSTIVEAVLRYLSD
jgi:hypothetical protein